MNSRKETEQQFPSEIAKMRQRIAELEASEARRKRVEEALRQSEERYRTLMDDVLDTSAVGLFVLDSSFQVVWVNQAMEAFFGLHREEVVGKDKRQLIRERIKDIFEGPAIFAEKVFATYDSNTYIENFECHVLAEGERKERWLEHWSQPIKSGLYAGGRVEHYTDVTERKRAEEEIRLLSRIAQQTGDGMAVATVEGYITFVNQAWADMHGYERSELIGKHLSVFHSERQLREDVKPFNEAVLRDGRHEGEVWHMRRDGSEFATYMTSTVLKSEDGKVVGMIGAARDITNQKRLEEQLRQSQKLEAVGLLAGGIAHDFNNLLTAITGYSEMLLSDLGDDEPCRVQIEEINRAARRAASLTHQLLAFSRKQMLQPEVLDLNSLVTNLERMLQRVIGEDIYLSTVLEPQLGLVKADPGQIEQVIMNLAVNARDAMPQGGKLTIETANVALDEEYLRDHAGVVPGAYVMLAVSDTGCGMDEETREKVFEPFFSTKKVGEGTGLGLSTVYGIVKQSGGAVYVYSEPDIGTTFKVYLPRVEIEEAGKPVRTRAESPQRSGTILVVDDDPAVRNLAVEILQKNGYTILEASSGQEAISVGEGYEGTIHLLMTDMVMPDMDGRQLAHLLGPSRPQMKMLYSSGYAIAQQGLLNSRMAFLQKPFTPQTLVRKVREVLGEGE